MAESDARAPRALLLTAGLGTRLRPLTYLRAKAAVPINGEPLAGRAIRWLARAGIRDLVLNLHHRPATIASVVGDGTDRGVRVRYSWEQPVLGSAGGPRHALPLLADQSDDDILLVNGDTLTDLDVWGLVARHRESGALVTMALIENPRPQQYGGVLVAPDGWVTGFGRAKGAGSSDGAASHHFIGVQIARARVFADLDDGVPAESVNMLYPKLISQSPRSIAAHVSRASFLDIGRPLDYLETCLAMAEAEGPRLIGARPRIGDSAVITRTAVWDDVTVHDGAQLTDCILGDGAEIPQGARFERCAIVPRAGLIPAAGERIEGELLVSRF
jgi:mannose-1-phosphate guanylyltransferase